jgi:hypothetical protein
VHDENLIIRFSARAPKELKLETARALAAIMHRDVKGAGERRACGGVTWLQEGCCATVSFRLIAAGRRRLSDIERFFPAKETGSREADAARAVSCREERVAKQMRESKSYEWTSIVSKIYCTYAQKCGCVLYILRPFFPRGFHQLRAE